MNRLFRRIPNFTIRCFSSNSQQSFSNYRHNIQLTPKRTVIFQVRNKVWSSNYPPIGLIDHCIYTEIVNAIRHHVNEGRDTPALISAENPNHSYTFQQLLDVSQSLESFLHDSGFQKGDVVTAVLPNCIEYPAIFIATIGRSGIFSGASPHFEEYEIHRQIEDNKSKIVFTTEELLRKVLAATKNISSVKKIVCFRSTNKPLPQGVVDWKEVAEKEATIHSESRHVEEVALLPYSSGTTGVPKGVQLTHLSFLTVVRGIKKHFEEIVAPSLFPDRNPQELIEIIRNPQVHFLPFYHAYGQAVLIKNILLGCPLHIMKKFDSILYLELIQKHKIWNLYLVPPVALFLAKDERTKNFDLSSLRYAISAAAPLGPELGETFLSKFPRVSLVQGNLYSYPDYFLAFGMSETSLFPFLPAMEGRKGYASVGKVAQEWEAKVVDLENGKELETQENGEICVRGPGLMKGYLNRIAETESCFDEQGWFHTGDIGHFDEHGELYIVDRLKEMIKVKGLQVAPAELESVLAADSTIKDVAVVGIKHEEFGEVPKAFVVPAASCLSEEDVKKIIADKLAQYKQLAGGVEFIDEIPKSASGKILRRQLRDRK